MDVKIRILIPTLGDFCNGFPVYDAIAKKYGSFVIILPQAMRMFAGIKEFVAYQGFASMVLFENEVIDTTNILPLFELDAPHFIPLFGERDPAITTPFMTSYVEMFLKHHLKIDFTIDNEYRLKVKDLPQVNPGDLIWCGDRWAETLDHRRKHSFMGHLPGMTLMDYKKDIFWNLNIIKKSKYPFVSTFTGVSILADLIGKENVVVYGPDMNGFMGWTPEFSYHKHYFTDRKSYICDINAFKASNLTRIAA